MQVNMMEAINKPAAPEVTTTSEALVPQGNQAPALYTQDSDAEGEFDASDIEKPKLVIVAKTGQLSNEFAPGSFLLNKEYVIGGTKQPLDVVPVGIKKLYQNDLDFDSGDMGDTVSSAVQVQERGGIVGYRPFTDKTSTHFWKPVLQAVFLIRMPEGLDPDAQALFPYQIEGVDYTVAGFWASAKTAYNGVAKPLIMAKQAKGSVRLSAYKFSTKGESTADNTRSWIQATLRATGATSEAITKFLNDGLVG